MKSAAIVLGLALAVNAQVDNELATSFPSHPSGADLVRNAGWGRSQPIHVPPKHTNPVYWSKNDDATDDELMVYYTKDSQGNRHYEGGYTVRRDDVADDELVQTFYSPSGADLVKYAKQSQQTVYRPTAHVVSRDAEADDELYSGAELVKYAKQSQQTVYRPTAHVVRDDEGDDELMVYYTKDSQGNKHYQGGYTVRRDDEVDDELMVYYTKDSQGNKHYQGGYTVRRDDVADDELVQTFYSPSGADLVKYAKQSQQTVYRPTAHVVRDDADDELAAFPSHPSGADLVRNAGWGRSQPIHTPPKHTNPVYWSKNDDATDDELMVYYTKDSQGNKHYQGGYTVRRDDVADDELVQTFYSPSGADLVKYAKQSQQTVYRPTAHVVSRDAEADDELAYLGHLIRETQPEKTEKKPERRHFRHEKN